MSRKKISTTIYVTPEQSDRLKVLHERTKVPVAVYIREGIDLVLRQYAHLLPGQLPLVQPPEEAPRAREPRRRSDASQRELPSTNESSSDDDADTDETPAARAAEADDAKTGLDKVAAGAKK